MKLKLKKMNDVSRIMLCAGVLILVFLLSKYVFKSTILEGMKGTDLTKDDKEVLDKQKEEFKKKLKNKIKDLNRQEERLKKKHKYLIDDELVNLSKKAVNAERRVFKEKNRLNSVNPNENFSYINHWALDNGLNNKYISLEGGGYNEKKEKKKNGIF